jgi:hypothetical protein
MGIAPSLRDGAIPIIAYSETSSTRRRAMMLSHIEVAGGPLWLYSA